jgi:hypothetical protein
MQLFSLFLVAFGAAFAVIWLLMYIPNNAKVPFLNKTFSPRLIVCKALAPFDAGVTLILVAGGWLGITSAAGLGVTVFNVLSGIGLSMGILFTKKILVPRWEKELNK